MIRMTSKHFFAALAFLLLVGISPIFAQGSAFTYQGKLAENGNLANSAYDFQFKLYDAVTGGAQQGSTLTLDDVPVTNGIFTVSLDFGLAVFTGGSRFIEVSVRVGAESGAYTTLAPRQPVASTPYAVRSINAASASLAVNSQNLGGVPANQYVVTTDTRLSDDRNPLPSSPNYIQNTTSAQATSNFNISGNGTAGGTLAASIVKATTQYNIGVNRVLSTAGVTNLFVGTNAGFNNTGSQNTFVGSGAGFANTAGGSNTFVGRSAGASNTTGNINSFFGTIAGFANTTGLRNSFFGTGSGEFNTTGQDNSFFGAGAGGRNETGSFNSYFGVATGFLATGNNNSFFGYYVGHDSTTANNNSYFGYQAGTHTTTGNDNSFFGTNAGAANTTGDSNAFFGRNAGNANTSSDGNAMFGAAAGQSSTGSTNSFFGNTSGLLTTTGSSNAFFGANTGFNNSTGSNNTLVGANANVQTGGLSFATAIGAGAVATADDSVVLGRSADTVQVPGKLVVTTLGSAGSTALCRNGSQQISTCSSSIRYKTHINSFNLGMQLINRLRPVTFNWKATNEPDLGFVAEEVAAVEPLLTTRNAKGEVEGVKYDRVAVALVNAVKEQQETIKQQQQQLATLRQEIEELKRLFRPALAASRTAAKRK
jgi:hypothetical protein